MNHRRTLGVMLALPLLASCAGGGQKASVVPKFDAPPTAGSPVKRPTDTLGGIASIVQILLEDAPPNLGSLDPTAIDIGVDSVDVISNGVVEPIAAFAKPQVVNVMAHQDANPASIGIGSVFSGQYQQLRFTVDVASSKVVAGGRDYPIAFSTGDTQSSSGAGVSTSVADGGPGTITMTVTAPFNVGDDPAKAVEADFNALESLALAADGSIVSRPTLFAAPTALAGVVEGTVVNADGKPVSGATVVARDAQGGVANTASTDENGHYRMHTIAAGLYSLQVYNVYTNASGGSFSASGQSSSSSVVDGPTISVEAGATSQAGAIND